MSKQVIRFAVIGALGTVINYAVFFTIFRFLGLYYLAASAVGFLAGLVFNYSFNRLWTFTSVIGRRLIEFCLYLTVNVFSLLFGLACLRVLVEIFSINPLTANLLAIGVSTVSNFTGIKLFVFHRQNIDRFKQLARCLTPLFWVIALFKLISGSLFASPLYVTTGFLPFIVYFVETLKNPYQFFLTVNHAAFPYPGGMLAMVSLPFFLFKQIVPAALYDNVHFQLFLFHLPIIAFDILIYLTLCYLLPTREKQVLWLYFASPILFYINYLHGQLDAVPTALLVLSLFFLLRKQELPAFLLLGLGIAAKTHLLAALPFYLVYLYRARMTGARIIGLSAAAVAVFAAVNPYFFSEGFLMTVFNNPEQRRLFNLLVPFGFGEAGFFLAPAALLFIFYRFVSYRRLNTDFVLLTIGLVYTVLVALVPPMIGWFYWSLPFLIFFFIKFREMPLFSFWVMNVAYLLYFAVTRDFDIAQSFSTAFPALASWQPQAFWINAGIKHTLVSNVLFTALESSLLMNIFWSYRIGVSSNELYQERKRSFAIGVSGDSGVGKSTLTALVRKTVGDHNLVCLNGDDVHKWERGHQQWQVITHLNPQGNFIHTDLEHVINLVSGRSVQRPLYDHRTGAFSAPATLTAGKFVICQGLLSLMLKELRDLYDLKIFIEADEPLRVRWKVNRDAGERGYTEAAVQERINQRRPDAEKFIRPQREFADWVIRYVHGDSMTDQPAEAANGSAASIHEPVSRWGMEYELKTSIAVDELIEALSGEPSLAVTHRYRDINVQQVTFRGTISQERVKEIAYRLFPNMFDLVENDPQLESNFNGISQLFFVNALNNFYRLRLPYARLH